MAVLRESSQAQVKPWSSLARLLSLRALKPSCRSPVRSDLRDAARTPHHLHNQQPTTMPLPRQELGGVASPLTSTFNIRLEPRNHQRPTTSRQGTRYRPKRDAALSRVVLWPDQFNWCQRSGGASPVSRGLPCRRRRCRAFGWIASRRRRHRARLHRVPPTAMSEHGHRCTRRGHRRAWIGRSTSYRRGIEALHRAMVPNRRPVRTSVMRRAE